MKIISILLLSFTFSFADSFFLLTVTGNSSFDYFFSLFFNMSVLMIVPFATLALLKH